MARQSKYTDELADLICERVMEGESLRGICRDSDMPDKSTVLRWLDDDASFATKYARAREIQGDLMDELILSVADACTTESAQAARVKIDAYKWRASKLRPKVYGDRLDLNHSGNLDVRRLILGEGSDA